MEYIISRSFALPDDESTMEKSYWFNMWQRRFPPLRELVVGDFLYWYDATVRRIRWKTKVSQVDRFPYGTKSEILRRYPDAKESPYFKKGPSSGYFLSYKVKVVELMDVEKPNGFNLHQLGWQRVDDNVSLEWFGKVAEPEEGILDENLDDLDKPIGELLAELDRKMQDVDPDRVARLVSTTIRKDSKIVRALKKAKEYKCEFPGCGKQIKTKKGGFYIEVAQVRPVSKGGRSILGNLVVLCPNHHKEFDYGLLDIAEQSTRKLVGKLYGSDFEIVFDRS